MENKLKKNNESLTEAPSVKDSSLPDEQKNKKQDVATLQLLLEHLQKMRYLHKSSVGNYALEIRKLKKIIAVEQSKLNNK